VSRGGEKLDHALDHFNVAVDGRRVLDAGASTGGFTDCLLQRGAREVIAVDVGRGQLHERLRTDPRVHVIDRTNVRHLTRAELPSGEPADVVVADLSFISLRVVAAALLGLAQPSADLVLLVKPQFEAGRAAVSKGRGVVTDPVVWREAILGVRAAFAPATTVSVAASPLLGAEGNAEFLVHVRPGDDAAGGHDFERELDAALDTATELRRKAATHALAEGR
jgi:23S rRNA (cytidine1920-2'-O)/16S rRNA (cytidine1409-2'-O)-methyltransferase